MNFVGDPPYAQNLKFLAPIFPFNSISSKLSEVPTWCSTCPSPEMASQSDSSRFDPSNTQYPDDPNPNPKPNPPQLVTRAALENSKCNVNAATVVLH